MMSFHGEPLKFALQSATCTGLLIDAFCAAAHGQG
jgi:hypothetical protein